MPGVGVPLLGRHWLGWLRRGRGCLDAWRWRVVGAGTEQLRSRAASLRLWALALAAVVCVGCGGAGAGESLSGWVVEFVVSVVLGGVG